MGDNAPDPGGVPLVVDASSDVLSRRLPAERVALLYAGAQKNLGPAGVTVVAVRDDLLDRAPETLPAILRYRTHRDKGSLYHTPPTFAVYLLRARPPAVAWESRWLRWPDLWLPRDRAYADEILHEAWANTTTHRVEIACTGGRGRTGTALACLAIIDGVPAARAIAYVRRHYDRHAIETPWQKRYVAGFTPSPSLPRPPSRRPDAESAN